MGDFQVKVEAPYDNLFVPTVDTLSYTKVLHCLLSANKKVYFTGNTGVGKSVIV